MKRKNLFAGTIVFAFLLFFTACNKDNIVSNSDTPSSSNELISENGQNPDEAIFTASVENDTRFRSGFIFTESNDAANNSILCYRQHDDGQLILKSTTISGGVGTGAGLGSQGAIILDEHHEFLYAVNAGGNSVSSFKVHNDGSLSLRHTAPTGGTTPVSVTTHHNLLYVVNAGSDNISGFRIGANGNLTAIAGSIKSLSGTGTGPARIAFSFNGNYLYVTEKATNMITTFPVDNNGVAGAGSSSSSIGQTPFGFEFAREHFMIVSNAAGGAAGLSSATSYSGVNSGNLDDVNGAVNNNQAAACWVAVTQYGRFAFVTNTASNNISSYYVGPFGGLYLIHSAIGSGNAPTEIIVSANNKFVYTINSAEHTITEYKRTLLGGLTSIGTLSNIPNGSVGIASF
ncbi:MAG: beta-propeller fold lactonase family protein [Ignavibacteria bacterium]